MAALPLPSGTRRVGRVGHFQALNWLGEAHSIALPLNWLGGCGGLACCLLPQVAFGKARKPIVYFRIYCPHLDLKGSPSVFILFYLLN